MSVEWKCDKTYGRITVFTEMFRAIRKIIGIFFSPGNTPIDHIGHIGYRPLGNTPIDYR